MIPLGIQMLDLYIEVIQLRRSTYFWMLLSKDKQYARSSNIDQKAVIMKEALEIAAQLELEVIVNERPDDLTAIVKRIFPNAEPDLDFDDDLASDAQQFGLDTQGVAEVAASSSPPVKPPIKTTIAFDQLEKALRVMQEVFGETNSKSSVLFLDWTYDVLEGRFDAAMTKAVIQGLREDRFCYIARLGRVRKEERSMKACWLGARLNAVVAACNLVRAVQNKVNGKSYNMWIEKVFWRVSHTEADRKGEA